MRQRIRDRLATRDVELRLGLVVAVRRADRDGEGVNARRPREVDRLLHVRQGRLVALRDVADLALARRAHRVRVLRDERRILHVLRERVAAAVVHHGGVAPGKGVLRLLDRGAVVEVQRHGHLRARREPLEHAAEVVGLLAVEEAHVELDDDRLVLGLGGLENRPGEFVVRGVERPHGALLLPRLGEHVLHVDESHFACPFS